MEKNNIKEIAENVEVKPTEISKWFDELHNIDYFEVEYRDKKFKFKKFFPIAIKSKIDTFDDVTKASYLMAYLSIEPKLTLNDVKNHMPSPLTKLIGKKIKEFNPKEKKSGELKTTSPKKPISSS